MRKWILYSIGFIVLWNLLTRRPNGVYTEVNGQLVPMPPQQAFNAVMASLPQQPGYGSPYNQPLNYNYNPNYSNPTQPGMYQNQYYPPSGQFQSNYSAPH